MTTLQQKIKYQIKQYHRGLQTELDLYQELYNLAIEYNKKTINKLPIHIIHNNIILLSQIQELQQTIREIKLLIPTYSREAEGYVTDYSPLTYLLQKENK